MYLFVYAITQMNNLWKNGYMYKFFNFMAEPFLWHYLVNLIFKFTISELLPVLTGGPHVPAPEET